MRNARRLARDKRRSRRRSLRADDPRNRRDPLAQHADPDQARAKHAPCGDGRPRGAVVQTSLAHLRVPARHCINVRTTNLLERSFEEERRRTKVIPRLLGEESAMKLVFATLIRVSDRWQRVAVSDLKREQLCLLRRELDIDPDPGESDEGGAPEEEERGMTQVAAFTGASVLDPPLIHYMSLSGPR